MRLGEREERQEGEEGDVGEHCARIELGKSRRRVASIKSCARLERYQRNENE